MIKIVDHSSLIKGQILFFASGENVAVLSPSRVEEIDRYKQLSVVGHVERMRKCNSPGILFGGRRLADQDRDLSVDLLHNLRVTFRVKDWTGFAVRIDQVDVVCGKG